MKEQPINQSQSDAYHLSKGKTTVAPDVLLAIARLTTLEVEGVSRMSSVSGTGTRLFKRGYGEGVRIGIREDVVNMDLYVVLKSGVNIRDISKQIQSRVMRAISEMVGMQVGRINVHIEDIDFSEEINPSQPQEA